MLGYSHFTEWLSECVKPARDTSRFSLCSSFVTCFSGGGSGGSEVCIKFTVFPCAALVSLECHGLKSVGDFHFRVILRVVGIAEIK
jgi:hypothetical protein